jgi:hypothetical protein
MAEGSKEKKTSLGKGGYQGRFGIQWRFGTEDARIKLKRLYRSGLMR